MRARAFLFALPLAALLWLMIFVAASQAKHRGGEWRGGVTASWYGPGLYGNPFGCSAYGTFDGNEMGVANLGLPCGYPLRLKRMGRVVRVRVMDRGPYVAGRYFDLTPAVKSRLRCPDLCRVHYRYGHGR